MMISNNELNDDLDRSYLYESPKSTNFSTPGQIRNNGNLISIFSEDDIFKKGNIFQQQHQQKEKQTQKQKGELFIESLIDTPIRIPKRNSTKEKLMKSPTPISMSIPNLDPYNFEQQQQQRLNERNSSDNEVRKISDNSDHLSLNKSNNNHINHHHHQENDNTSSTITSIPSVNGEIKPIFDPNDMLELHNSIEFNNHSNNNNHNNNNEIIKSLNITIEDEKNKNLKLQNELEIIKQQMKLENSKYQLELDKLKFENNKALYEINRLREEVVRLQLNKKKLNDGSFQTTQEEKDKKLQEEEMENVVERSNEPGVQKVLNIPVQEVKKYSTIATQTKNIKNESTQTDVLDENVKIITSQKEVDNIPVLCCNCQKLTAKDATLQSSLTEESNGKLDEESSNELDEQLSDSQTTIDYEAPCKFPEFSITSLNSEILPYYKELHFELVDKLTTRDKDYLIKKLMSKFMIKFEDLDESINRFSKFIFICFNYLNQLHEIIYPGHKLKSSDYYRGRIYKNGEIDEEMIGLKKCLDGMIIIINQNLNGYDNDSNKSMK